MNKENVVYKHNGLLITHKEEQNHMVCRKMVETGDQCISIIT
jgi:hypothetical protein